MAAAAEVVAPKYSTRRDRWGMGLTANPVESGFLGELTLVNFLCDYLGVRLQVNTARLPFGDGGVDIPIFGITIQVKNRRGGTDLLVRRSDGDADGVLGRIRDIESDVFVKVSCPSISGGDPHFGTIDGWVRAKALVHSQYQTARYGEHMNLVIPEGHLREPMELLEYLRLQPSLRGER